MHEPTLIICQFKYKTGQSVCRNNSWFNPKLGTWKIEIFDPTNEKKRKCVIESLTNNCISIKCTTYNLATLGNLSDTQLVPGIL